jgi:hypothetical protein
MLTKNVSWFPSVHIFGVQCVWLCMCVHVCTLCVYSHRQVLVIYYVYFVQGTFNGKREFFVYRAFIANTEIIILLLFNIVPF